jgi:integrin beta 3
VPGRDGAIGEKGDKGADGKDGLNGRDGTLENLKMLFDGERTVTFCFKDGTPIEGGVIRFPIVLDKDVWTASATYEQGDVVSWGGSMWIARQTTTAKPGTADPASAAWRLAVQRGREGKPGKDGNPGPPGPKGDKGDEGRWAR